MWKVQKNILREELMNCTWCNTTLSIASNPNSWTMEVNFQYMINNQMTIVED